MTSSSSSSPLFPSHLHPHRPRRRRQPMHPHSSTTPPSSAQSPASPPAHDPALSNQPPPGLLSLTSTSDQPSSFSQPPVPALDADRAFLDAAEHDLLKEIQLVQKKLTEARQRQALRKNRGLLRRNPSVSGNILSMAATPRRSNEHHTRQERPLRQRIISVSLRLPTARDRHSARQQLFDEGLPPKAIFSLQAASDCPFVSVGTAPNTPDHDSLAFDELYGDHHRNSWRSSNHRHRSGPAPNQGRIIPVTLPGEPGLLERYEVFCEDILWRLLHYDYSSVGSDTDLEEYWNAYRIVNQRFAETVSEIYEDGDLIWVHNYHLMLLPSLLRESLWYAKIGFFLYTPFPSAELFRILPHRAEILKGVLGSDLIGFHSYEYSKQFVASCSRLLGLDGTPSAIEADTRIGRRCELGIYPAGIDVRALREHVSSKIVKSRVAELRARFEGFKIVVGFDRLDDSFGGIPLKLLAFEQLLMNNSDLIGSVVMVQVAMIPRHSRNMASYRAQQVQVNELVGRINSNYGTLASSPVHYINTELDPVELHALMCVAHVCVVSTVRDGMGLVPHEWTVCQHTSYKGPIILSEFAGAAHSFATALHVNPWDVDEVAAKIQAGLDMSEPSRLLRNDAAYRFVTSHTAKLWGFNFLEDLEHCERPQGASGFTGPPLLDSKLVLHAYFGCSAAPSPISSNTRLPSINPSYSQPSVSPHVQGERISKVMLKAFGPLTNVSATPSPEPRNVASAESRGAEGARNSRASLRSINKSPRTSSDMSSPALAHRLGNRHKLFILDFDGTLVPFQAIPELGAPPQHVVDVIKAINDADPFNHVLVISSRTRPMVMQWLGDLDVYLAAEDGAYFRAPRDAVWTPLFRDAASQDYSHNPNSAMLSSASPDRVVPAVSSDDIPANEKQPSLTNGKVDNSSTDLPEASAEDPPVQRKNSGPKRVDSHSKGALTSFTSVSSLDSVQNGDSGQQKWKTLVLPVLQHFAERTPGVLLEEGDAILTWHYTDSDTDFGQWQARDLYKHLESFLLQSQAIDLISDEGRRRWIKVRSDGVDKAKAIRMVMKNIRERAVRAAADEGRSQDGVLRFDFVLCIGDDRADESMFEFVRDEGRLDHLGVHCPQNRVFTCKVGSSTTNATSVIDSPARVVELLEELAWDRSNVEEKLQF